MYSLPIDVARLGVVPAGRLVKIAPANPVAGAEFNVPVPATYAFELLSLTAVLVAAVALGNRSLSVRVDDGAGTLWVYNFTAVVAPGGTSAFVINTPQFAEYSVTNNNFVGGPRLIIPPGGSIQSTTGNLDGADQWQSLAAWGIAYPLDNL